MTRGVKQDHSWQVPVTLRVDAPTGQDARAKVLGLLLKGHPVPGRNVTVGRPVPAAGPVVLPPRRSWDGSRPVEELE
jgi:hypothetical protein